jgi:hypothetical protein
MIDMQRLDLCLDVKLMQPSNYEGLGINLLSQPPKNGFCTLIQKLGFFFVSFFVLFRVVIKRK